MEVMPTGHFLCTGKEHGRWYGVSTLASRPPTHKHTRSLQTLGFALPIVERLLADQAGGQFSVGRGYGRPPSCIIMLPTRELAKQVGLGFGGGGGGGRLFAPLPHPYCPVFLAQANAVRRHN